MRFHISKMERRVVQVCTLSVLVLVGGLVAGLPSRGAEPQPKEKAVDTPTNIATGSGKQYKTTVDRKTEGELSAEDFRQASLLSSRIVMHLNKAVAALSDEKKDEARQELERGLALTGVVRGILPTTTITTVVRDSNGKEVYRYIDRVQEDRIPLHEGMIAVNTVEPITDAKQDDAAVKGIRLADAELVHTSVLMKLDFVESRLNRAIKLLDDKCEDALAQLRLAQSQGMTFLVNKEDDPLVKAQMALQLAERMAEQGREEAAKANLQLAKNHLDLYRGLLPQGKSEHVGKLQAEITKLQAEIGGKDAAKTIRGFWDRVASWFMREPGETRATTSESPASQPEKKKEATR